MLALCKQMATLHVRNVPDHLYELLRERAEGNGRSIGAEATILVAAHLTGRNLANPRLGRRRRSGRAGLFARFTDQARASVVAAADEARALGHAQVHTEHLVLGVPSYPIEHPDRYALQMVATVLGGGM